MPRSWSLASLEAMNSPQDQLLSGWNGWLESCRVYEERRSVALGVTGAPVRPPWELISIFMLQDRREKAWVAGVFMVHLSRHLDKFQFSAV